MYAHLPSHVFIYCKNVCTKLLMICLFDYCLPLSLCSCVLCCPLCLTATVMYCACRVRALVGVSLLNVLLLYLLPCLRIHSPFVYLFSGMMPAGRGFGSAAGFNTLSSSPNVTMSLSNGGFASTGNAKTSSSFSCMVGFEHT